MKILFGGFIAVVLLGLYLYCVGAAVSTAHCLSSAGCSPAVVGAGFTDEMASTLALIGGLISALVIAELSITQPGEVPVARVLDPDSPAIANRILKILTLCYLLAWVSAGLWAFIVGYLQHPRMVPSLTDLGQAWLGLSVAAGYAYFGIRPR